MSPPQCLLKKPHRLSTQHVPKTSKDALMGISCCLFHPQPMAGSAPPEQPLFGHSWNKHQVSVVAMSSFLQGDNSYHQKHSIGGLTRLSSCSAQEKNSVDALAGGLGFRVRSGGLELKPKYLCCSLDLISAYFSLYAWNVNTEKYTKQNRNPLVKRHFVAASFCFVRQESLGRQHWVSSSIFNSAVSFHTCPSNTQHVVKDI